MVNVEHCFYELLHSMIKVPWTSDGVFLNKFCFLNPGQTFILLPPPIKNRGSIKLPFCPSVCLFLQER